MRLISQKIYLIGQSAPNAFHIMKLDRENDVEIGMHVDSIVYSGDQITKLLRTVASGNQPHFHRIGSFVGFLGDSIYLGVDEIDL
jgi:hypothetical protein